MPYLKRLAVLGLLLAGLVWASGGAPGLAQTAPTLQQQVNDYAAQSRGSQAVAALRITPEGTETALAGQTGNPTHPLPTADTLFEIGSITKVFTALLLAAQVHQGALTLDTPADTLLSTSLTLQSLASHTAGLPRLPLSRFFWSLLYPANPYRGSQPRELHRAIATADPDPTTCQYSNLGPALLGQRLATAAGQPYETLVQTQVLTPLGLTDTHFDLDAETEARLAQGHRENTLATANWQFDAYAPAGGLKSTLTDMGQFLAAAMAADWPPLALSLQPQSEDCEPNFGLGWIFTELEGAPLIMHNGRTGGYYAFVGWLPDAERGLVLLTNTSDPQGDGVATALLTGEPLPDRTVDPGSGIVALVLVGLLGYQSWSLGRSPPPRTWLKAAEELGETLLYLVLAYQLGPWQWLPVALWWGGLALLVGLSLRRLWRLRASPPAASPGSGWRSLGLVPTLLLLGWAIVGLR
ncbi:serine hydrolase domain-containing protein [Nodosilinea sp. PGN35]|uniref:serine hydrolase domain-containing protein n=1 Tax=Nodosilinea sp. PGN35 TaxID=3020489 RepID=UPI0023B27BE3|nr:serine hydrolase domain-containing protein [Nodosilinea sp. TSF1-S3]MDF0367126.1 serine hydrolase [Nodosilinea sp. TSF1-S3]